MEIYVEKGKLDDILDVLGALVDEAVLEFEDDQLVSEVVDPANVGFGGIKIDENAFDSYSASGEKIGINLARLRNIISLADSGGDVIHIDLDNQRKVLEITVNNIDYTLALIDPDSIRPAQKPGLTLDAEFELEQSALDRGLTAANMVSDTITFKLTDDGDFIIEASGDTDDVEFGPEEDDGEIEYPDDFDSSGIESVYSLDYLTDINKAIPTGATIDVGFDDEMPLQIEFQPSADLEASYILAPRIQQN